MGEARMDIVPYCHKAHFYETDKMGIIHHSNYFRWFEEARVDFMDQIGLPYIVMEEAGIHSPLIGVACDYKSMVRFNDRVIIHIKMSSYTGVKMAISYEARDAVTNELRAIGETRHCFLNSNGKIVNLRKVNKEMHDILQAWVYKEE